MKEYIEKNLNNMINDLSNLVKYRSILESDELPFGAQNKKVIDEAISIMNDKGFKTENIDYYACSGEIGQGEKVIGILAHLDVVPEGNINNWNSNPFELTIKDDKLIGRGVCDDKGAAVASMWAMKYLLDTGYKFNKRVRLILGCNEENGSACMKYYVNKLGNVDLGFTPDGEFPGIYSEKGIVFGHLESKNSKIIDIEGGEAKNIICPKVIVKLPNDSFDVDTFKEFLNKNNIKHEIEINEHTLITVYGKAGHSASPYTGINSLSYLLEALYLSDFNDSFTDFFHKYIGLKEYGENIGFPINEEKYLKTSAVATMIKMNNGIIETNIDIRYPYTLTLKDCKEILSKLKDDNNKYILDNGDEPLYFNTEDPMLKSLLEAYQKVTGDKKTQMLAIAGSTYAKSMKNIIAFGCQFLNEESQIHQDNEWLSIDSFKKQVMIYIEAIKKLNEL